MQGDPYAGARGGLRPLALTLTLTPALALALTLTQVREAGYDP